MCACVCVCVCVCSRVFLACVGFLCVVFLCLHIAFLVLCFFVCAFMSYKAMSGRCVSPVASCFLFSSVPRRRRSPSSMSTRRERERERERVSRNDSLRMFRLQLPNPPTDRRCIVGFHKLPEQPVGHVLVGEPNS